MKSDGGPPAHHGKAPPGSCSRASLASADSRCCLAMRGSSILISAGSAAPCSPRDSSSHGVSSRAIWRFASAPPNASRAVSRFASSCASRPTAG
jgi:hypothetical protein